MADEESRVAQVRQLAANVLPDSKLAESHAQATFERMVEANGRALGALELLKDVEDAEEVREYFLAYADRVAQARAAILDHSIACLNLARRWAQ